ncbi:MAG: sugar ABC transporter permease [Spirochaetales bacterium]|nr:sugar ABC transporter permease [Spirochaetales bacterium]
MKSEPVLSERANSRYKNLYDKYVLPFLFILPAVLLFTVFAWFPILKGFYISFLDYDLLKGASFTGLDNFKAVLSDPLLPKAVINTLYFTLLAILFGYVVPVFLAIAINEMRSAQSFFRLAFYIPVVLPPMVAVLLWKWFYDPDIGLANVLLNFVGLNGLPWLNSPKTSMFSLIIMSTWANAGGSVLIYLAALKGIPVSMYEAAELEGAGIFQRIRFVTIPQILGVMLIMLVLQIIGTMQVFTEPFVMTDGGPANSTLTIMMLLYRYGFKFFDFGAAGALGLLFFFLLVSFSLVYFRLTKKFKD